MVILLSVIGSLNFVIDRMNTHYGICSLEREREKDLYSAVVTGTHYGTKTLPDQQPACYAQGYSRFAH
jgi:hypothetical protein